MKIGVVGCGALGSFYGAKLAQANPEVHFLLRSDYETVRRRGVQIRSREGDFVARPRAALHPESIGVCDLVLIGLKTTANAQFPRLLPPLVGPQTLLLTLQNGLGNENKLAAEFGTRNILGGLCFVCLNRVAPGVVHHLAHGRIVLGEFQRGPEPRTHTLAAMFRQAGVPCQITDNLERTHWEKLAWNIPFNGLGVASAAGLDAVRSGQVQPGTTLGPCLGADRLLADSRWEGLVRDLMREVLATADALGFKLDAGLIERQIMRTREMGAYRASTLVDFERQQPLELESLFLEPLRQAQAAGVATPRLAALGAVLQALDRR